ncbi:P22U [Dirofilaria immitis]|nr:P22U [Dirofilaria immitis]
MRFVVLLVVAIWIEMSQGQQMIKQCKCSDIAPCQLTAVQSVLPCADQCQKYITSIGGNYDQISNCFKQKQSIINDAMKCAQDAFPNACAQGEPKWYQNDSEKVFN